MRNLNKDHLHLGIGEIDHQHAEMDPPAKLERAKSGPRLSDMSQDVAVVTPRGSGMIRVLGRWLERILEVWRLCQVELRGGYSVERLIAFDAYSRASSPGRILTMFFGTAVPCLLAIVVLESIPLAPIEDGIQHSRNFWFRTTIGTMFVTLSFVSQFRCAIPDLDLSTKQLLVITVCTTGLLMPILYAINLLAGFPMPFFVVSAMAPWYPIVLSISWALIRDQLREKPQIIADFKQQTRIFNAQSLLIILYPSYTYVFNSYPDLQTWLAVLLPVMKLVLKNLFGFASRHMEDSKPELVVFNVEIFSALYVSSCMQSASSQSTTIVIMAVDFVQAWMAIKDLYDELDDPVLKQAVGNQKDATRILFPLTKCILEVNQSICEHPSIRIKSDETIRLSSTARNPGGARVEPTQECSIVPPAGNERRHSVDPVPAPCMTNRGQWRACGPLHWLLTLLTDRRVQSIAEHESLKKLAARLSEQEQLFVVQKTLRILHIAEFIALIEYAEVFVPIVYSLFCVIAYTFPNGQYYTTFGGLSVSEFARALVNVILYGSLELLSFVGLDLIMRHKFRVSTFVQTAFVQETQWAMIQSKLALWILVVPQFALQHYGSDFSFQFKWLKR